MRLVLLRKRKRQGWRRFEPHGPSPGGQARQVTVLVPTKNFGLTNTADGRCHEKGLRACLRTPPLRNAQVSEKISTNIIKTDHVVSVGSVCGRLYPVPSVMAEPVALFREQPWCSWGSWPKGAWAQKQVVGAESESCKDATKHSIQVN